MLQFLTNYRNPPPVQRRHLLQAGGAGLLGLTVPRLLAAEEVSPARTARAKNVIFLFLFGGPSQLETFDMKPAAPSELRGPFKPIDSRTPGLRICEHLPRLAAISDKFTIVRSMTHSYNDHSGAGHYLQTGHRWHIPIGGGFNPTPADWPSIGSVVEHFDQRLHDQLDRPLPSYVVIPNSLGRLQEMGQYRRPGEHAGWLGQPFNPLTTVVDKRSETDNPYWRDCEDNELTFQVEGLASDPAISLDRNTARRDLLDQFDASRRQLDEVQSVRTFDRFRRRALGLVSSNLARNALDIRQEPAPLRDTYGRHLFGQSCLMARRLVEAGVRFVTVHYDCCDGYSWDSHVHSDDVQRFLLPTFDQGCAALLDDLSVRGMLDETLVIAIGEMGRTPSATPRWGRGHWSTLFSALIAGGGVRRGALFGGSDKDAAYPIDSPTSPEDLASTLYYALGIDPESRIFDSQGRPTPIVPEGKVVMDLFG